jgi:uncharacterized protein (DUF2132 family)
MNDEINYKANPLHGVSLKNMLTDVVNHYGFEILFAYLNINCFKTNPSIASSVKFLKKTDWARAKVENFYLYEFKNLPRVSYDQFQLSPRDRIIPDNQEVGDPAELSLEDAERLQKKRAKKATSFGRGMKSRANIGERVDARPDSHSDSRENKNSRMNEPSSSNASVSSSNESFNPWTKSKKN